MPPPTVLKKRHTLKGKNLLPLALRFKTVEEPFDQPLARPKMNKTLESMSGADLRLFFFDLTGTSEKDILGMAEKPATEDNLRVLAHLAIVYANECGEPVGQELIAVPAAVQGSSSQVSPAVHRPVC